MIGRFDKHNDEAIDAYYMADYHGSVIGPSVNLINNLSLSLISMFGAILYIFTPSFTLGTLSFPRALSRKFSGPSETANIISEIQSASSARNVYSGCSTAKLKTLQVLREMSGKNSRRNRY